MIEYDFVGVIPARGGSKGIPKKNIVTVSGKPLIYWTIKAAQESCLLNYFIVSSEDKEILEISKQFDSNIIKRPCHIAEDFSNSESVIVDAIQQLKINQIKAKNIVLLQPTSPLRTSYDIDKAIELYKVNSANALISVFSPSHSPYKAFTYNQNGYLKGLFPGDLSFKRRQDLPEVMMPNGAIYLINSELFMKDNNFCPEGTIPFIMEEKNSYDIDTLNDIDIVELEMKKAHYNYD